MAFCKFSTEHNTANSIVLHNAFIAEYLPEVKGDYIKVYLYGLLKCHDSTNITNTLKDFAAELNMKTEDVKSIFYFWQEQGLVTVLNLSPIEVRYLPFKPKKYTAKMFDENKYSSFNHSLQEIIDGRMLTPHEYKEFYDTMISMHIEQDAMLMIAKYCTNAKGNSVGYNYILTVAKNWAYEGVHTAQDVENKISDMENVTSLVKDVLVALKSRRQPNYEDREMFNKWTKQFGFDLPTIVQVAKTVKKGGIDKLNEVLDVYYQNKLFSIDEITEYENNKDDIYNLAKDTCKALGLYYQNLEPVVSNYILKWKQMGYQNQAILLIAKICFKKFIRTLDEMEAVVNKYFAKGLVSIQSINDYIAETLVIDKDIKKLLESLNLNRQVTSWDRDFYHVWKNIWQFGDDIINYAVSLAVGKSQPMQYINKILSNWKEQNISTLNEAKQTAQTVAPKQVEPQKPQFMTHSFSSEELNALFDNLDEVKIA